MAWTEIDHPDAESLAQAVADDLAAICRDAIEARGRAILALAGGRTPYPAYRRFAASGLPWSRVHVIATDDRCVPHAHAASNTRELRWALESARGIDITPLGPPDGDPDAAEAHARRLLGHTTEPFDAVLLGMGGDGHTASLFPGSAMLAAALADDAEDAYRIDPLPLPPEAPFARVTLSARRLLHTDHLLLAITGESKREVLRRAQAQRDPARLPICAFLHAPEIDVQIHWSP